MIFFKLLNNFSKSCNNFLIFQTAIKQRHISKHTINLNSKFKKMIMIRFEQEKVSISLKCQLTPTSEREFNLNRNKDEAIHATFAKLYANYMKQLNNKSKSKKLKKEQVNNEEYLLNDENVPIYLYDLDNNLVSSDTRNGDAWKENFTFKMNEQEFKVTVDLPFVKKLNLSKLLISGMPATIKSDFEPEYLLDQISVNSKYFWYYSDKIFSDKVEETPASKKKPVFDTENVEWILINFDKNGLNSKYCILTEECRNRLIKVVCIPNDGKRDGIAQEHISTSIVQEAINLEKLPMTERHKETNSYLDSNNIRVMSYNILANCYADTALARDELFNYCPSDYLDFKYRRLLLIHEIANYKSDVIFLQECDSDFYEEDLLSNLNEEYTLKFKAKGESKEGECILFRTNRFKFIKSHDISIANELKENVVFEKLINNLSKNNELKELALGRNTILQVVEVESLDKPGYHYLLANTHFFFHPKADFIRLLQAICCAKYLEKLKYSIKNENKSIKEISILMGGDFNSDPPSHAFTYMFTQSIPFENLNSDEKLVLKDCDEEYMHSINLSAFADFPFTNCTRGFTSVLDYVFYETNGFELKKTISFNRLKYSENFMPSKFIPSDHVAILFELLMK